MANIQEKKAAIYAKNASGDIINLNPEIEANDVQHNGASIINAINSIKNNQTLDFEASLNAESNTEIEETEYTTNFDISMISYGFDISVGYRNDVDPNDVDNDVSYLYNTDIILNYDSNSSEPQKMYYTSALKDSNNIDYYEDSINANNRYHINFYIDPEINVTSIQFSLQWSEELPTHDHYNEYTYANFISNEYPHDDFVVLESPYTPWEGNYHKSNNNYRHRIAATLPTELGETKSWYCNAFECTVVDMLGYIDPWWGDTINNRYHAISNSNNRINYEITNLGNGNYKFEFWRTCCIASTRQTSIISGESLLSYTLEKNNEETSSSSSVSGLVHAFNASINEKLTLSRRSAEDIPQLSATIVIDPEYNYYDETIETDAVVEISQITINEECSQDFTIDQEITALSGSDRFHFDDRTSKDKIERFEEHGWPNIYVKLEDESGNGWYYVLKYNYISWFNHWNADYDQVSGNLYYYGSKVKVDTISSLNESQLADLYYDGSNYYEWAEKPYDAYAISVKCSLKQLPQESENEYKYRVSLKVVPNVLQFKQLRNITINQINCDGTSASKIIELPVESIVNCTEDIQYDIMSAIGEIENLDAINPKLLYIMNEFAPNMSTDNLAVGGAVYDIETIDADENSSSYDESDVFLFVYTIQEIYKDGIDPYWYEHNRQEAH